MQRVTSPRYILYNDNILLDALRRNISSASTHEHIPGHIHEHIPDLIHEHIPGHVYEH